MFGKVPVYTRFCRHTDKQTKRSERLFGTFGRMGALVTQALTEKVLCNQPSQSITFYPDSGSIRRIIPYLDRSTMSSKHRLTRSFRTLSALLYSVSRNANKDHPWSPLQRKLQIMLFWFKGKTWYFPWVFCQIYFLQSCIPYIDITARNDALSPQIYLAGEKFSRVEICGSLQRRSLFWFPFWFEGQRCPASSLQLTIVAAGIPHHVASHSQINLVVSILFAAKPIYLHILVGSLTAIMCLVMLFVAIEAPSQVISRLETSKFGETLFTFRGRYMVDLMIALFLFAMGVWGIVMASITLVLIFGIRFLGVKQPDAFNEIFRHSDPESDYALDETEGP